MSEESETYDVVVAGSGAGGLAAAITAANRGLSVLVIEKAETFGGTTSRSGGWIWVPDNPDARAEGIEDSRDLARTYIRNETGNYLQSAQAEAYLEHAPQMLDFFRRETRVSFSLGSFFSDYHPEVEGGLPGGRALNADPCDRAILGTHGRRLTPPLPELTFMGMMIGSNKELKHFFAATRSVKSFGVVGSMLARYGWERLRHGQPMRLTNGAAMVARMAASAFDLGVEIRTSTPLLRLEETGGRVTGAIVGTASGETQIGARLGVVLATGGFPGDAEMRQRLYGHAPTGKEHWTPAWEENTGDGMRAAMPLGARFVGDYPEPAAWIPVSLVPQADGGVRPFPHLVDRAKPGVIAVAKSGRRFMNEAVSYHDFVIGMREASAPGQPLESWLVADHRALRKYGLGHVKPAPIPLGPALRSGYLLRGDTPADLARAAGFDPESFEATIKAYNDGARRGEDPEFGKGTSAYSRCQGDPEVTPNPCVAPLETGPYYAIRLVPGDLGSFAGLRTDATARVLDEDDAAIPGLYAAGNDAASFLGGAYIGAGITLGPAMTFGYLAALDMAGQRAAAGQAA